MPASYTSAWSTSPPTSSGRRRPTYRKAITTTDARIGRLLRAIRTRPSYPFESWTIIVVTDHGERPLDEPSLLAHYGKTKLELTSFLIGAGPGLGRAVRKPRVVDVLPTVLHQLGLRTPRIWGIDGRSLSNAKAASSATAKLRGRRLTVRVKLGARPRARAIRFRLPAGLTAADATVRVNGTPVGAVAEGRNVVARAPGRKLRSVGLAAEVAGSRSGGEVKVTLRGAGTLAIPLR